MVKWLVKRLTREQGGRLGAVQREAMGKVAGLVGIASNLVLFALKLTVGTLSGSISITADAVNNLSDCGSSVITLAGFHLAARPADKEHPYGHARFEYISGLAVAVLVLLIGAEFLKSAVDKILHPAPVDFSPTVLAVLGLSVLIKLWQGSFNKQMGAAIDSGALAATATDSRNDAAATTAVLLAALAARYTGWNLDGWMGLGVAGFILCSGVGLIRDTIDPLLGTAADQALVAAIRQKIMAYPSVVGMHDLAVHNYGPGRQFATVHVEVPASQDILLSHDIIDTIERDVGRELGLNLVIHLDPIVTDDARTNEMRALVQQVLHSIDPVLTMHDFRMVEGKSHTNLIFDIVAPHGYRYTDSGLQALITERLQALDARLYCVITVDHSYVRE